MNFNEEPVVFQVAGEQLLGIVAKPDVAVGHGVLIIVGGPQYRVGSHRQFILLSRRLAAEGYPSLRFDYRGIGDSEGAVRDFEAVSDDIGAAVNTLRQACPTVKRVVLWGLCDAASAALLYMQATRDPRVAGLVLLNPWVRSEASLAQTHIKHYYGQRLMQREFWSNLLNGKVQLLNSVHSFLKSVMQSRGMGTRTAGLARSFQDRMADGLRHFSGEVLLILSGQDYTAKEFLEYAGSNAVWSGLADAANAQRIEIEEADHTFSARALRVSAEDVTLTWLARLEGGEARTNLGE
jgi:exosortase A-associated hydrolase 1